MLALPWDISTGIAPLGLGWDLNPGNREFSGPGVPLASGGKRWPNFAQLRVGWGAHCLAMLQGTAAEVIPFADPDQGRAREPGGQGLARFWLSESEGIALQSRRAILYSVAVGRWWCASFRFVKVSGPCLF